MHIQALEIFNKFFPKFNAFVGNTMVVHHDKDNNSFVINDRYSIEYFSDTNNANDLSFAVIKHINLAGGYMNPPDTEYQVVVDNASMLFCLQFVTKNIVDDKINDYLSEISENDFLNHLLNLD